MPSMTKKQKMIQFSKIKNHEILIDQFTALHLIDVDYKLFKPKLAQLNNSYKKIHSCKERYESRPLVDQLMLQLVNASFDQIDKKHLEYFQKQWEHAGNGEKFMILVSDLFLRSQHLYRSTYVWIKDYILGKFVTKVSILFLKIGDWFLKPIFKSKHNDIIYDKDEKIPLIDEDDKIITDQNLSSQDIFFELMNDIEYALQEVKFEFFYTLKYHELFIDQMTLLQMMDSNCSGDLEELSDLRSDVEEGYKTFIDALQSLQPQLCMETRIISRTEYTKTEGFLGFTSLDWFLLVLVKETGQCIDRHLDDIPMTQEEELHWVEFRRLFQLIIGLFHSLTGN
ncbi:10995_t:CDS:1 [Dentiscutata erythropus]|uniref:10995_t:CDS:1 n=1 Tax=Dentiscutata erythropus TaxID=1348616 RepID=A0A9N9J0X6_9GLOM|nr:10995_t:CDS:1 [Dentiscutata erythropus]